MPPSIVLEVMKVLEKEIWLRDETRTLEQARPALVREEYGEKAQSLATTQLDLAGRIRDVSQKLRLNINKPM